MIKNSLKKGFSLIEVLLYFIIIGIFLGVALNFIVQVGVLSQQSENAHEIQSNIDFIAQKMSSSIRIADSINDSNSTFDSDAGKLSLLLPAGYSSPITFQLSDGNIQVVDATGTITINSDFITCTKLRFEKVTYPKSPDQIVIDAICEPKYIGIPNLEQSFPMHTSISLKK